MARYRDQHLLLITHGGTIQLLLSHLLDAPLGSCRFFAVPCACLLRLQVTHTPDGDYPQLLLQQPPLESH
jgi:broad specificity phosphatase PhoE